MKTETVYKEDLRKLIESLSEKQIEYIYYLVNELFGQASN